MSVCPYCHQPCRPEARYCAHCRTALRRCSICGCDNRLQARFCAQCRSELTRACVVCGGRNRPTARFCQHCRAALTPSAAQPPLPVPLYPVGLQSVPQPTHPPAVSVVPSHATGMLPAQTLLNGRYLIVKKVGGGGMGAVYKATDSRRPGQIWAIKEMSLSGTAKPDERAEAIANFQNEAAVLGRLSHINLPTVEEVFQDQNQRYYMVMEFVDGRTLLQYLEANGGKALPEAEVLEWAAQLCDVLEYLHNQPKPIIYRDLKPENVMIEQATGCLKLIDFGIVRFYKAGKSKDTVAFGTVGYAPPEQSAAQTDERSDIYAMAATLHHLLTGRDPKGETPWIYPPARQINSRVSAKVEAALERALEANRSKRPQNIAEFRSLLGVKAGKQPTASRPAGSSSRQIQPGASLGQVAPQKLDFGAVGRGQRPTRSLQVRSNVALAGNVVASHAWLQVSPTVLIGNKTDVDVTIDTSQLPLMRFRWPTPDWAGRLWRVMEPSVRSYWWALLIGLVIPYINIVVIAPFIALAVLAVVQALIWWTLLHASWLVQEPCQHSGQVEVQTGASSEAVDVTIEVTPDPLEQRWRWVMAVGLVIAEFAAAWWVLSTAL